MSKRPSLVRQVNQVLTRIFEEGSSRHTAKASGTADGRIFSFETLRAIKQRVNTSLRRINDALPDDGQLRYLRDLKPAHMGLLVAAMRQDGLSDTTIKNHLGAFRKLARAMQASGWSEFGPDELVPDAFYLGLSPAAPRGGYAPAQADQLLARLQDLAAHKRLDPRAGLLARLIRASGLRHNEAARLREVDLDREQGTIFVRSSTAKGGRERTISLDDAGREQLRAVLDDIPAGRNWLFLDGPNLARQLQDALRESCVGLGIERKGMHGLRGTFAEEYLARLMADGLNQDAARDVLAAALGHNRRAVTYRYVPRL